MEPQRTASWWIHWEDLNWPDPDNMDKIKRRAEGFAKANVTAAMIFGTHFRWDWLPVFPLLHDYLATVAEELHKYGVKLYDHHSVNLVHRYSSREEMRHVMKDSGPHLPFSPTWEAAATWQYKGKYLNDWRMVDVRTGKPAYCRSIRRRASATAIRNIKRPITITLRTWWQIPGSTVSARMTLCTTFASIPVAAATAGRS